MADTTALDLENGEYQMMRLFAVEMTIHVLVLFLIEMLANHQVVVRGRQYYYHLVRETKFCHRATYQDGAPNQVHMLDEDHHETTLYDTN